MNYQEALSYIHSNFWQGSKPGLSRTRQLLEKLGNPQDELRFIHVAGTNGKGSFCAMLSSILIEAGLRVGTYTSPYILRFNERMKFNGNDIADDLLAELTEYVRPFADEMEEKPTEFELITAIAMEFFKRQRCDLVVLECGMGGRLDSTNIIQTPILSVITGIALDHTSILGDTIEAIAKEKAGIIKPGIPILYCGKDPLAKKVINEVANNTPSDFFTVDRSGLSIQSQDLLGTKFDWKGWKNVFIPLLGTYQTENAQNVLRSIELLRNQSIQIDNSAVLAGLKKVRWPARFETVRKAPLIICDGGHNPQGVDGAVESAKLYFPNKKLLIVTGVMKDKDYLYMVSKIGQIADKVFCLTPENPRALAAEELAQEFEKIGVSASAHETPKDALSEAVKKANEENIAILCVGSLYMYGQIIEALDEIGV